MKDLSHKKFRQLFWLFEYRKTTKDKDAGICFGIACLALQLIQSGKGQKLLDRLRIIERNSADELFAKVQQAEENRRFLIIEIEKKFKNKDEIKKEIAKKEAEWVNNEIIQNKNNPKFVPEYPFLITMRAFFETIAIYFQPQRYPFIFAENSPLKGQDAEKTFAKVFPDELMELKKIDDIENVKIKRVRKSLLQFNQDSSQDYFRILTEKFENLEIKYYVSFLLSNSRHSISIHWLPNMKNGKMAWSFIDANELNLAFHSHNFASIAICIMRGLTKDIANLDVKVYAHQNESKIIASAFQDLDDRNSLWKEIHKLSGKKANRKDSHGTTLLYIAAKKDYLEELKILLEVKANPNIACQNRLTPLHLVAAHGNLKEVKLLIDAKADFNPANKYGETPLYFALKNKHFPVVAALPNVGADLTKLLTIAARFGHHANVAQWLLENKANPKLADNHGLTPLHIASKKNRLEIVKLLLDSEKIENLNVTDNHGATALFRAAERGYTNMVKELIKAGAGPDYACHNGATAFYIAAQNNHLETLKLLLTYTSDKELGIKGSVAVLREHAEENKKNPALNQFLKSKGLAHTQEIDGFNALHAAVFFGHVEIVKLLLAKGVNPDAYCGGGKISAWELAQLMDCQEIESILYEALDKLYESQNQKAIDAKYDDLKPEKKDASNSEFKEKKSSLASRDLLNLATELKIQTGKFEIKDFSTELETFKKMQKMRNLLNKFQNTILYKSGIDVLRKYFYEFLDCGNDLSKWRKLQYQVNDTYFKLSIYYSGYISRQAESKERSSIKFLSPLCNRLYDESDNLAARLLKESRATRADFNLLSATLICANKVVLNNNPENRAAVMEKALQVDKLQHPSDWFDWDFFKYSKHHMIKQAAKDLVQKGEEVEKRENTEKVMEVTQVSRGPG